MKPVTLVLITNHFPFGQGESFLEHEIPVLAASFEKIVIISKNISDKQTRTVQSNIILERVNPVSTIGKSIRDGLRLLTQPVLILSLLLKEREYLKQRKKTGSIIAAFHFLFKAFQLSLQLRTIAQKHKFTGNICFYSYWLNASALAITLNENSSTRQLARAHGGDLYEYRQDNNYLPFREALAKKLTQISPISLHGCMYLKSILGGQYHAKIRQANLGTPEPKHLPQKKNDPRVRLVSCSSLIALKRVHLIVDALTQLADLKIEWIHFGDGLLRQELSNHAATMLPANGSVTFNFKGFVANKELLEFYSCNYVDLFINTSQYEGVPVSMMEAQSFGIPIIGTDVGAVSEIVTPQTGYLLGSDPTPEEIARAIRETISKSSIEIGDLRQTCRRHWEKNYNAAHNFSTFASDLKNLF